MIAKVRLTTTRAALRQDHLASMVFGRLGTVFPDDLPDDAPVNLLRILDATGPQDVMWVLRYASPDLPRVRVAICSDIAERVLWIWEAKFPDKLAPRECIAACRRFVAGEIEARELERFSALARCETHAPYSIFETAIPSFVAAYTAIYAAKAALEPDYAYIVCAEALFAAETASFHPSSVDPDPRVTELVYQGGVLRSYLAEDQS